MCCRMVKSVCGRVRSSCGEGCGSNVEVSPEEMKNVPWRAVGRVIVNKTSHYSCGWPLSHINIGRSAPHPELQSGLRTSGYGQYNGGAEPKNTAQHCRWAS